MPKPPGGVSTNCKVICVEASLPRHPMVSVVVPFYNEGANVERLFDRLLPVLTALGMEWEVVCVNDGSRDDTVPRLAGIHARQPNVKVVDLSRNFGKEVALTAGLSYARGNAVVIMDADLQHPPETIPGLLAKWRDGFEMVYAVRHERTGQSLGNRMFARLFYWVFDHLSDVPLPREAGDFRLLDRKVVDAINAMPERTRFMKGIYAWVGFRHTGLTYIQDERSDGGTSRWSFRRLLRLAIDGLTAFSNFPLRVWLGVGVAISSVAFLYIIVRLIRVMVYGIDVPGYESTLIAVLFMGGMQLITLGIVGDYLGRVFNEVKGRPLFIVRSTLGIQPSDGAAVSVERPKVRMPVG